MLINESEDIDLIQAAEMADVFSNKGSWNGWCLIFRTQKGGNKQTSSIVSLTFPSSSEGEKKPEVLLVHMQVPRTSENCWKLLNSVNLVQSSLNYFLLSVEKILMSQNFPDPRCKILQAINCCFTKPVATTNIMILLIWIPFQVWYGYHSALTWNNTRYKNNQRYGVCPVTDPEVCLF